MCHVFHQDYIVKKGYDYEELEHEMLKLLDKRGAQYPAEHNVGHLYEAKPTLKKFYKALFQMFSKLSSLFLNLNISFSSVDIELTSITYFFGFLDKNST